MGSNGHYIKKKSLHIPDGPARPFGQTRATAKVSKKREVKSKMPQTCFSNGMEFWKTGKAKSTRQTVFTSWPYLGKGHVPYKMQSLLYCMKSQLICMLKHNGVGHTPPGPSPDKEKRRAAKQSRKRRKDELRLVALRNLSQRCAARALHITLLGRSSWHATTRRSR